MTERPLSITTQVAPPIQAVNPSSTTTSLNDALPVNESVEEEPYTIKCICDYSDDDGNTIYCEACDTWQHIECYYPGRVADASREEFDHSCADCKPRLLDSRHATERQRQRRHNRAANDPGDKKSKRPPSKSHKKKVKTPDVNINGYHDNDVPNRNGSTHEHHNHTKKAKGHRSSQSITSQVKRSPPLHTRPISHGHPPSPAHTPPDLPNSFRVHTYSDDFLCLYDNHHADTSTTNSFASLSVTNSMTSWLQDFQKLQEDAGVKDKKDVFDYLTVDPDTLNWPDLRVEFKESKVDDVVVRWRSLTTTMPLPIQERVAELTGLVGFQKDYCNDPANRWTETAHPRPFTFFHPRLPLFIDTRREGSTARYVRRSCRANTTLETFIANNSDYYFWLISERQLHANEQITIPWDFRFPSHYRSRFLHLLNLGDEDGRPPVTFDITDDEYEQLTTTIQLVLSDYGGCACDLGRDCSFARFHRHYLGRAHNTSNGVKAKKSRKIKQSHVSPTSTGHATNSRAASEGQDQYDEDDNRSRSDSVRSKPQSRDLTPLQGVGEANGIMTEPSDREKRKLAMLEDTFRKMESQPRKKKRTSDGSNNTFSSATPTVPKPRQRSTAPRGSISQVTSTNAPRARQYVDASTSRNQSGSPFSAVSPGSGNPPSHGKFNTSRSGQSLTHSRPTSVKPRAVYSDSRTQTDPVQDAWWASQPKQKRTIVPLAMRLLRNRRKIQAQQNIQFEAAKHTAAEQSRHASPVVTMDSVSSNIESNLGLVDHKNDHENTSSIPSVDPPPEDVSMTDASFTTIDHAIKPPPPPLRNHAITSSRQSPDLRVQMPPAPSFPAPNLVGPLASPLTPSTVASTTAQSPLGAVHFPINNIGLSINGVTPSPVKTTKKLTLSEYQRMKHTDTNSTSKSSMGSSPTTSPAIQRASLSNVEESKVSALEGSAIVCSPSPMVERTADPLALAGAATTDTKVQPSGLVNGGAL